MRIRKPGLEFLIIIICLVCLNTYLKENSMLLPKAEPEVSNPSDIADNELSELDENTEEPTTLPELETEDNETTEPDANTEEKEMFPVWVGERIGETTQVDTGYEFVQNKVFGNTGHMQDFESREAFLKGFGFEDSKPVYQYFDQNGRLQLELYADEELGNMCGVTHEYSDNGSSEENEILRGFTLCTIYESEWEERDKYTLKTIDGYDGTEFGDWVTDIEECAEYREDGKLIYYESTGRFKDFDDEIVSLLKISFTYREDGTLYCRDYSHHSVVFSTYLSSLKSFYDEKERLVFETGYITHGHVEFYYIYEDESDKPTYCMYLDYNLGYVIPEMAKYS